MYGVVSGLIKKECHKNAPNPSKFAEYVVDIYSLSKPQLNIVDGNRDGWNRSVSRRS